MDGENETDGMLCHGFSTYCLDKYRRTPEGLTYMTGCETETGPTKTTDTQQPSGNPSPLWQIKNDQAFETHCTENSSVHNYIHI